MSEKTTKKNTKKESVEKVVNYEEKAVKSKKASSAKKTSANAKKETVKEEKTTTEKEAENKVKETKKANKSFNSSKPENAYYSYLISKYSENDIIRQYKDERYPHACDFYIRSLDLFIELNIDWTHGGHPFNPENQADINKLAVWQEKAKKSKFYQKAIETWTKLDVQKFKDAKYHNLNYKVYYAETELYE